MKQQAKDNNKCPLCGTSKILQDPTTGEAICNSCGYVYQKEMLSTAPEWRAFNLKERQEKTRVGAPLTQTIHDRGLSTNIGYQNRDHTGRKLAPEQRNTFYRLRKWNRRSKKTSSSDRNLTQALGHISQIGNELGVPRNVTETGATIYRQALKKDCIKGRTIEGIAAVSLYIACRVCEIPKNLSDIAAMTNNDKKSLARDYRYLVNLLDKDIPRISTGKIVSKLVQQLELSGRVEKISLDILETASTLRLTNGKSPSGMAASIIYIACNIMDENRIQKDIAEKAQVTSVTIRNRYKELMSNLDIETSL
ncbi:transcription initiation factor IIB [Candidatus Bathyarchaeota archaeon]|nr:transcription initiation factor IIB [Candidatus Bathyarchaeota archaeon]